MKISASYWMFEGGLEASIPVADAMAQAKSLGFDAIELCIASSGVLTHEATQVECEAIVARAKELEIEIASVASGESWGCSPTDDDPTVRSKIVEFTEQALPLETASSGLLSMMAWPSTPGNDRFRLPGRRSCPGSDSKYLKAS